MSVFTCLGIESTAHTFGIGIVRYEKGTGEILANKRDLFTTESGGMIPAQLAEHHVAVCGQVLNDALEEANITLADIDLVAFSQSPGFGHTLRIGAVTARTIAHDYNIPIVGVNHCIAHLEVGDLFFDDCKDPILLYTSGVNTQVISFEDGKYRILGETLDNGVGNFLDSFARHIGLGFPGGPKIQKIAEEGKNLIELPYVVKGMDISVGGMLTNAKQKADKGLNHADLAYSIQETLFAMLTEIAERALAHTGKTKLLIGGGVGCNTRLQEMLTVMCKERGATAYIPPRDVLVDNGVMIAWLGIKTFLGNNKQGQPLDQTKIDPYLRTDEVEISWK